jgi:hypothetical protein
LTIQRRNESSSVFPSIPVSRSNPGSYGTGGTFIDIFEEEAKKIEDAAADSDLPGKIEFFLQ